MEKHQVLTVLVADDEPELLGAVCQLIDWESLGFRLVGRAGNGLDALQMVEALQPDFLLTDIRMPFISGMFSAPARRSTATMKTAIPICACSAKPSTGSSFSREKPSPTTTRWASARRKRATSPPPPTPATA